MPIINLSATERLISTSRTWEWQYLKTRKHRITKEPINSWGFYRNYTLLESALSDVVNTRIRTSRHEDIAIAVSEVKDWMASLSKALIQQLMDDVKQVSIQIEGKGQSHGTKP